MGESLEIGKLLPIIAPLLIIQAVLMTIALVLCVKAERTRGPKLMWVFVIILINLFGPIAFLLFGRKNA